MSDNPIPDYTTVAHIDLSVSDAEKSADWYGRVLRLRRVRRADFDHRIMIVLRHEATGLIIGLNQHDVAIVDSFDERNLGLDHIGFGVAERADLDALQLHLAELGVEHSPVTEAGSGAALVFRDPDNIQLEFWWTRPQ
ncbi:MAG: VOC family protein [Jiangellaceae bacterium]